MKTLKVEGVYPMAFETFADVVDHLPRFIDRIYNDKGSIQPSAISALSSSRIKTLAAWSKKTPDPVRSEGPTPFELPPPFGDDDPPFEENLPKLVDQRRTLADHAISSPMQALQVDLLVALQTEKLHHRASCCFRKRFGIPVIVFLRLHVGTKIFRRHQANVVTLIAKMATQMMSAAARFHRRDTQGHACHQLQHGVSPQPASQQDLSRAVHSNDTANILAEIDARTLISIHRLGSVPFSTDTDHAPKERSEPFDKLRRHNHGRSPRTRPWQARRDLVPARGQS